MLDEKVKLLKEVLGSHHTSGQELLFYCPFCSHNKRKLSINAKKLLWKCWFCDTSGRNVAFIIRKFGTRQQYQLWLEINNIKDISNFDVFYIKNLIEEKKKEIYREPNLELPKGFETLTSKHLPLYARGALNYLIERGVTSDKVLQWRLGYCTKGQYEDRIIFPSFNENGNLDYFVGRAYTEFGQAYRAPNVSKDVIFNDINIDWEEDIVIVEGVFDAIKASNAIPLLGSTLKENSRLFNRIVDESATIYIALDKDVAKKERRIIQTLLKYGITVYKIDLDQFEDVGEMSEEDFELQKSKAKRVTETTILLERALSL